MYCTPKFCSLQLLSTSPPLLLSSSSFPVKLLSPGDTRLGVTPVFVSACVWYKQ